jgi:hypothetical protein
MSEYDSGVNDRKGSMNPDRFVALVDAYGADPSRWPAGERAAAEAFAASQAAPKSALEGASELDRILNRLSTEEIPAGLRARILAAYDEAVTRRASGRFGSIPAALGRFRDAIWPGAPLWQPASAFALSLAIGLAMGLLVPSAVSAHDADPSATLLVVTPAVFDLGHGN